MPRLSARSLELQLPLAAGLFFAGLAVALTVVGHREVRRQAKDLAGARLAHVADQLASTRGLSVVRAKERLAQLGARPELTGVLLGRKADSGPARATLATLTRPADSSIAVSLWNLSGQMVIAVGRSDSAAWAGPPPLVDTVTISPLGTVGDTLVYFGIAAPIRAGRRLVGLLYVVQRLRGTEQAQATVTTLVGAEGTMLYGSRGGVWTNLERRVEGPPLSTAAEPGPVRYVLNDTARIGAARGIPGTPWLLLVEVPESVALAPTRGYLRRVGAIAGVLVLLTTVAAGAMGRSITRPLRDLRDAAEAFRAGAYGRRAAVSGHPEIGQVARTFNDMAAEIDRHFRALAESEERFRSLATATAQIVWWTDPSGDMVGTVPSWQAYTGQTADAIRGAGWTNALHPDDAAAALGVWKEAVTHRSLYEAELRIRRHDGEYRRFVTRGVPVLNGDGSIREWVGTCTDITDRREAEERLHRKEAELHSVQRLDAIGRLAGGVAHDFNNLLTAIIGPAELAAEALPPEHGVQGDLRDIRDAAQRAGELTKRLLVFGRQQVLNPVVLDLNEVVQSAGRLLQRVIPESIKLELALSSRAGKVKVDRTQLEQVLINLAVNARDAMPDGGRLTIETSQIELTEEFADRHPETSPGPYVVLSISDTGVGMDEETRSHLFEPFFTTKEIGKGTGLGLSTVYGIVRQSGGHVWVYSEPGRGTVVKTYFLAAAGEVQAEPRPEAVAAPPVGTGTILLAEDEPALLALGTRILERLGYNVVPAASGEGALAAAHDFGGHIDLLLSDVVMPGMDGLELWQRLRRERPDLPALFLSGWASDAVVRHGILEGEVPFLQKPFTADQLGRKIREVLGAGFSAQ